MRSGAGTGALRVLVLVLAGAALGAALGVLWEAVWEPPTGVAYEGEWVLAREGLTDEVGATAWFAVLGFGGGLVYGLVAAWATRGRELLTLLGVCLGSVLAAWVMYQVGHALGPGDPAAVAATAKDMQEIPGDLRLAGAPEQPWPFWFDSSAFSALPGGALLGLVLVLLGSHGRPAGRPRSGSADPASDRATDPASDASPH